MNVFATVQDLIAETIAGLAKEGALPPDLDVSRVTAEPPRDPSHGDIASNAAMVLSKPAGQKPRDLAETLAERLLSDDRVTSAEVAGPGFLNLRLSDQVWLEVPGAVLGVGPAFGDSAMGQGTPINVEYVSANPTGPMHVGHGRGAVFGDALSNLLQKAGYGVTREYYVNDAGVQIKALADSVYQRLRVARGDISQDDFDAMVAAKEIEYGGDYLVPLAEELAKQNSVVDVLDDEEARAAVLSARAIEAMLVLIREDLAALGVTHDLFRSEKDIQEAGLVAEAVDQLAGKGLMYHGVLEPPKGKTPDDWEPREQYLFKATEFGDDVDRALQKSDGAWTYFASDIAYHKDKFDRGFQQMINVWGADHGGYVKRVQAALNATTDGAGELDVKLCQLVRVLDNGEPVRMSKRAGTFITLRDVIDRVGKDVVRFYMLTRKNDAQLDFDYARVVEKSKDNPVFYVQYAHARICSVLRHAAEVFPNADLGDQALAGVDLKSLKDPDELGLIKLIAAWPRTIEAAALAHEPHRLAFYLQDLAGAFHALWNKGNDNAELRFLQPDDEEASLARLALVRAVATVIASGLTVFGVKPVEEMR